MKTNNERFTFIDLFAGIGGFHQAMRYIGGRCVLASEIDEDCIKTYKLNHKNSKNYLYGDVNCLNIDSIPKFDVLCAGFPCQPFSKAGAQKGFNDEVRGNLFHRILEILDRHKEVKFIILENVRNLADKTENWDIIRIELGKRDFYITEEPIILSPSDFGVPQIRERVYILGIRKDIRDETILTNGFIHMSDLKIDNYLVKCKLEDAWKILEKDVDDSYIVTEEQALMIEAWDEFREHTNLRTVGFPIWFDYFGVGVANSNDFLIHSKFHSMPLWKQKFVKKNRQLYTENSCFIDKWAKKYNMSSRIKLYRKFEWNCGSDADTIKDTIIQIRQSGIRAKRSNYFPSLVAMANTPIIWDKGKRNYRRITPREAANLQSFHKKYKFLGSDMTIYKQLGNSVNVKILKILGKRLFELAKVDWRMIP